VAVKQKKNLTVNRGQIISERGLFSDE